MTAKANNILDKINNPKDLRLLDQDSLPTVCREIRDYIIECCSKNPGHLGASLGATELIVGLHYVYDTPEDKIIFDVGHQAYSHKILTERKNAFIFNRMKNGLSGFPNIFESEYDAFGTGHASTSISAALGIAKAFELTGKSNKVVALIGDGAISGGMAMEAMNNAKNTDILVILNDNNQSIDSNIGSFHEYLLQITTDPKYNNLKSKIWNRMGDGKLRKKIQNWTLNAKTTFVREYGGALFEALGFRYFGPIDGNNIISVVNTLKKLKKIKGPKILHAKTIKGKGYVKAEQFPTIWHAPGKFCIETGERIQEISHADKYQDVFGHVLTELAKNNETIVGITPAMCSGCGMTPFAEAFPSRFFDVGIEEEHAVTFAAGFAATGMTPFCNIYSSFSQRAYDQIIHDTALQRLPVILCFDRGGLVGEDGATHQGAFDMAAYRSIPNITISSPRNETELKNLMYTASLHKSGPFIIRYPRGAGEGADWKKEEYRIIPAGTGEILVKGSKIAIAGIGPVVNFAIKAAQIIKDEEGWNPSVYDMRFLKPADEKLIEKMFSEYEGIITVEEGCLKGGLFSEFSEIRASRDRQIAMEGIGIPDKFIEQDTQSNQRAECGLDVQGIVKTIKKVKNRIDFFQNSLQNNI